MVLRLDSSSKWLSDLSFGRLTSPRQKDEENMLLKRMITHFLGCFAMMIAAGSSIAIAQSAITPPTGWKSVMEGETQVFMTPIRGGAMTLRILPWADLEGKSVDGWLAQRWTAPFGPIAVAERSGSRPKASVERHNGMEFKFAIASRRLQSHSGASMASVVAACSQNGQVLIGNLYGPPKGLEQQSITGEAVEIIYSACAEGSNETRTPSVSRPSPTRPAFMPGRAPSGFDRIWYIGDFVPDVSGMRAKQKAVMTFEDGAVTDDIDSVFAQGRAVSERNTPKNWGRWRVNAEGEIEIKWPGSSKFKDFYLTRKTDAGGPNKRIDGCFSSKTGYSIGYGTSSVRSMAIKQWCFTRGGRFSTSSAASATGGTSGGAVGYSDSDQSGHYRIDGHVIQLAFDNGETVVTSFAMMDERDPSETTDLFLGSRHFD